MLLYILVFLVGTILGSFYNVVGLRIPIGKSIVFPKSHCMTCFKSLTFLELVPIFSYILQKGKCTNCHQKIHITYPMIEFLTGLLLFVAVYESNELGSFIQLFLLISLLMIIVVSDLTYMLIPNKILFLFFILLSINKFAFFQTTMKSSFICMLSVFAVLFLFSILTNGGIGGGDVKLISLLAFVFPYQSIMLLFMLSCLFGTIIGWLLRVTKRIEKNDPIPFGPYIAIATIITYYFEQQIIELYRFYV